MAKPPVTIRPHLHFGRFSMILPVIPNQVEITAKHTRHVWVPFILNGTPNTVWFCPDCCVTESHSNLSKTRLWKSCEDCHPKKKEEELPMDCPMCDTQKLLENRPHKITSGNKSSRYVKCKWGVKRLLHFHHLRQSNRFIRCHLPILLFPLHSIPLPEPLGNNQCFWP